MSRSDSMPVLWVPALLIGLLAAVLGRQPVLAAPSVQTEPDWSAVGENLDGLGEAVAGVGDVNGDGWDDIAVALSGNIYLYLGSDDGPGAIAPLVERDFGGGDLFFPHALTAAGDLNGDDYADFAAGAPFEGENVGAVKVYLGGPDGIADVVRLDGTTEQSQFGAAVSGGADLNGDGFDDLVVGAPGDFDSNYPGSVSVYLGSEAGLDPTALVLEPEAEARGRYGVAVALAGDIDGDGFGDLLVTAPESELIELHYGSADGLEPGPGALIAAEEYDFIYGNSLAAPGDLNGDGYADFAVSAADIDDLLKVYVYLGSPAGPAASADARIVQEEAGDLDGIVQRGGDVNGDGYADLLFSVAPPSYADSGYGQIHIHFGGPNGVNLTADAVIQGAEPGDGFGLTLDAAGDVNGDGFGDLIVGSPESVAGGSFAGAAHLFLGRTGGFLSAGGAEPGVALEPIWAEEAPEEAALFGYAVDAAGDVNGDGFPDFLVGAPAVDDFQGAVGLYFGGPDGMDTEIDWVFEGETGDSALGFQAVGLGDVDGDGYDDILVSAPFYDESAGIVYLFYGSETGPEDEIGWFVAGDQPDEGVGSLIAAIGDVNGDGFADAAVVISDQGTEELLRRILVYHGSESGLSEEVMWQTADEDGFGSGVYGAGDVNGDGYSDLLVVPYMYPEYEGAALVYHGGPDGLELEPAFVVVGGRESDNLGAGASALGDVDGDGYDDLALGVPGVSGSLGEVRLYTGSASGLSELSYDSLDGVTPRGRFGAAVAGAGDVNGDGYADLLVAEGADPDRPVPVYLYLGGDGGPEPDPAAMLSVDLADDYNWGVRLSALGDMDGDGVSDFAVGEPGYPGDAGDGRVTVYAVRVVDSAAGAWGPSATWSAAPTYGVGLMGWSANVIGDVNADGYADLLIGEVGESEGEPVSEIQLYPGSAEGVAESPAWISTHAEIQRVLESDLGYIAFYSDAVGDVNGDGYDDLFVSWVDENFESGAAAFYPGGEEGPSVEPTWVVADPAITGFGLTSAAAGDVNGDGFADLALYAGVNDEDGLYSTILLYYGSPDGPSEQADWQYETAESIEGILGFGTVGDLNGDGYDEFVIGSPGYPDGDGQGRLSLFLGGADGLETDPFWVESGGSNEAALGVSLAPLGDVNGDGRGDFGFSEPGFDNGAGRVTVVLVDPAGPDASTFVTLDDGQADSFFGILVRGLGDVNGDGLADLGVAATTDEDFTGSRWSVYLGNEDGTFDDPAFVHENEVAGEFLFFANTQGGDLNGDGYADFALAEADFGVMDDGLSVGQATVFYGGDGRASEPPEATSDADSPAVSDDDTGSGTSGGVLGGADAPPADDADDEPTEEDATEEDTTEEDTTEEDADGGSTGGVLGGNDDEPVSDDAPADESTGGTGSGTLGGDDEPVDEPTDEAVSPLPTPTPEASEEAQSGSSSGTLGGDDEPADVATPTSAPELLPTPTPAPEAAEPLVEIVADTLNVREGPGTDYPVIAQVNAGAVFGLAGQAFDCGWLLVEDNSGAQGWVSGSAQFVTYNVPCSSVPTAEIPEASAAPAPAAPAANSGQGCYLFINNVGPELTITFTRRDGGFNDTFKVPPDGSREYCLDPAEYTYTIDAPPPWNSINGELTVNAGDQFQFPIGRGE